jgi:hypothetical protein
MKGQQLTVGQKQSRNIITTDWLVLISRCHGIICNVFALGMNFVLHVPVLMGTKAPAYIDIFCISIRMRGSQKMGCSAKLVRKGLN